MSPLVVGLAVIGPLSVASPAAAAAFAVTTLADSGPGSLRQAVLDANASSGPDTISFGVTGTILLTGGELEITDPVTVEGPGAALLTIDAGGSSRVFKVQHSAPGTSVLSGLTLSGAGGEVAGGAVLSDGSELRIEDSVLRGNEADTGGGVYATNGGSLVIDSTEISGNRGTWAAGGIGANGTDVEVTGSSVSGNSADIIGGGIEVYNADLTVISSTIADNEAGEKAGIEFDGVLAQIVLSTISGNVAATGPAGLELRGDVTLLAASTVSGNTSPDGAAVAFSDGSASTGPSDVTLQHVTIADNATATAVSLSDAAVTVADSIIDGPQAAEDVDAVSATLAATYSLVGNTTLLTGGTDGNLVGVSPQLGGLSDNGGPTATMMPAQGSPVIDAGDPAYIGPSQDQRGELRILDGLGDGTARTDMGAAEAPTGTPSPVVPPPSPVVPTPSPAVPTPSPVAPTPGTDPAPTAGPPSTGGEGARLADTGADLSLLPLGLGLLGTGGLVLALARRTRRRNG